jgi:hypothetical protein
LRRDVAVDDAEGFPLLADGFVSRMEAFEHAGHDGSQDAHLGGLAAGARASEQSPERLALYVIHDQRQLAVLRKDIEDRHHVGVADARDQTRLVDEHRREVGVFCAMGQHALDRDRAREPDLADQPAEVHRGHAAGRDLTEQDVPSNDGARLLVRMRRGHRGQRAARGRSGLPVSQHGL